MSVKSREETRADGEGTSKAGKGPLKHHEENREGPGQKKNEETRKSSEEAGKKLRRTACQSGKDRGGWRPPRPPSRRELEKNQQNRGRAREENQQGWERTAEAP